MNFFSSEKKLVKWVIRSSIRETEKVRIVEMMADELSKLGVSKKLKRNQRIIKTFVQNITHTRKTCWWLERNDLCKRCAKIQTTLL